LVTNGFFYFFYPIPILHYINNFCVTKGPVWLNELGSWIIYTTHTSLSPIRRGFAPGFVNYKKRCTRLAAASDKVYQLLAHGRWFSPQALEFRTPPFFLIWSLPRLWYGSLSGSISLNHLSIFYNISRYNSLVLLIFVSRSSCPVYFHITISFSTITKSCVSCYIFCT
jgi:hypothetical protein